MNFTPPQAWLRAPTAVAQKGARGAPASLDVGGGEQDHADDTPAQPAPAPLLPAGLCAEEPLPGSAQWRATPDPGASPAGADPSGGVDCVVGDFTARAMQLAHLRLTEAARRGTLLPHQREAPDLLDAHDPSAVHLLALRRHEAVAAVRLLGLGPTAPSWPRLVTGVHAARLLRLGPAVELSQLAAQQARPPWTTMRLLVRAAVYLALAGGCRYLVAVARPHEERFWCRLGFVRTNLGSYVPSARPHVVELFVLDAARRLAAEQTAPLLWHHLFGATSSAMQAASAPALAAANAAKHRWRQPLCRGISRTLGWLPASAGDAYA